MTVNGEQLSQSANSSLPFSEAVHSHISVSEGSHYDNQTLEKQIKDSENMLHETSSSLVVPNVLSPGAQFSLQQSSAGPFPRTGSRGSSKPSSLSEMAGHDAEFSGLATTPTTPVFASSPFQPSSLSMSSLSSPGQISPSLSMAVTVGEKRKLKKGSKPSKEQTDQEKEEKKRRLAMEQEKERQWKLLQQQRLREQQLHQQTPAIQQVMMVKEQMRKDNKPGRKSELMLVSDNDNTGNEIKSNLLPHVEPSALTQLTASKDAHIVNQILETLPGSQSSKQRIMDSSNTVTTPSSHANRTDFQKSNLQHSPQIATSQVDFHENSLSPHGSGSTQFGFNSGRSQHGTELDSLLKISDSDLIKMGNSRILPNDVNNLTSTIEINNMPTVYVSKALTQLQMSTGGKNDTAVSKEVLSYVTESNSTGPVPQQQSMASAFSGQPLAGNRQPIAFAIESSNVNKISVSADNQAAKALSGFLLDSHSSVVQPGTNDSFDKQHNSGVGQQQQQQQQQQALFQQQQFMAAQQQYIQWQLQQRNPELFQSITTPIQFPSYPDKDLPEVDSEEQHQERIRFLYRQRQMQKQQVVQIQQQLHQQQVYTSPQIVTGSSTRPQMDQTQQYFVQQLMQYQQQIPEALQQQFLIEYSRQMQQRADVSQSALQYDKFLAELAQRYGFPVQQTNAQTMSALQQGITWPSSSSSTFNPNVQQIIAYSGLTEEKMKELTPQQLYQLQMQQTLMMQMAASGLYPTQAATIRHQSPANSVSRKGGTSATQSKKSRDIRKAVSQDKVAKSEASIKSSAAEDKMTGNDDNQLIEQEELDRNERPSIDSQDAATLPQKVEKLVSPVPQVAGAIQDSSSHTTAQVPNLPASSISVAASNSVEKVDHTQQASKESSLIANQVKIESQGRLRLKDPLKDSDQTVKEQNSSSSIAVSKSLVSGASSGSDYLAISSTSDSSTSNIKPIVCTDGVHCGTDSESDDVPMRAETVSSIPMKSSVCTDGVNCGTDSDDEDSGFKIKKKDFKAPCTDGVHCGTDSEGEDAPKEVMKGQPCSDGIHCGTDSEDEAEKPKSQNVCTDGIHCGTDSEDEGSGTGSKRNSSIKDNINDVKSRKTVSKVCSDGIHCGTDSEEEEEEEEKGDKNTRNKTTIGSSSAKPVIQQRPLVVVCRQDSTVSTSQPHSIQAGHSLSRSTKSPELASVSDANHTLEVIQEGDVTQTTFTAMENMNRNLENSQQMTIPVGLSSQSTSPLIKPQILSQNQELSDLARRTQDTAKELNIEANLGSNIKHPPMQGVSGQSTSAVTSHNISMVNEQTSQSLPVQTNTSRIQSPKSTPKGSTPGSQLKPSPQDSESRLHLPAQPQGQLLSPKAVTQGPSSQQVEGQSTQKQKPKVVGIPPTSPQYQQLFMHQHQLLIMQFQQYQYQLQAQYQQLSQQQMSPQQQFLLQQQYHQQMMLLQRQFVQQQVSIYLIIRLKILIINKLTA